MVVKNYVYKRYSGIRGIGKLNNRYVIQNEMTQSGLRQELGLPSVYYYPAVFEAIGDIKASWAVTRKIIASNAAASAHFTSEEKRYICYVLKMDSLFSDIMSYKDKEAKPSETAGRQQILHNYIRRQARKHRAVNSARNGTSFQVAVKGYLYDKGTIRLTTKVNRKRIVIPLTDKNQYCHQLKITLLPEKREIVIHIPIEAKVKKHPDYIRAIGVAMAYERMFTTSKGNQFGTQYGEMRTAQIEKLAQMNAGYNRMNALRLKCLENGEFEKAENIEKNNLGRQKYNSYKAQSEIELKAYINSEIDRMLKEEKPAVIYIAKLPRSVAKRGIRAGNVNRKLSSWQRGYISERLSYKCQINGVRLVRIFARDSSALCSVCGKPGKKEAGYFQCPSCGRRVENGQNIAENILISGQNAEGNG